MKYATIYTKTFQHLHEVDEIILNYAGSERLVTFVPELVGENKNQRIILNILNLEDNKITSIIPFINKLQADGYNLAIITRETEYIQDFKNANIPFFFMKGASNLETAITQCEAGVSDIYVVEELGFRMKDLQYLREHYGVQIRVYPNIAQSAKNLYIPGMCRFFIRPEDTELYEPYVDVFEILGGKDNSRLSVVYEIYKERQWLGGLETLILDLKSPVANIGINPHFGEMRLNCGKKCLIGQCNLCPQAASLSDAFVKAGVEIIKPRFKQVTPEEKTEALAKMEELFNESRSNKDTDDIKSETDI